jgi:KaiC/GvpD/RAD55 family RecA-like ATPase
MTDKTPIGVLDFFDEQYGGAFRGRPMLVSGESGTGKTIAAFHFINRALRMDERCLMLSTRPAADLLIQAEAMGMDFSKHVEEGSLILLEYGDDVPGRHSDATITLPPDSFAQLAKVISEQAVARLVLDTCLPWVAVRSPDRLEEHVFSFVRSLDRMGVTSMLTMPRAASLAAARLYKLVEDQVPVSVSLRLGADGGGDHRIMIVNKYLGMDDKVGREIPFTIVPGEGIVILRETPPGAEVVAETGSPSSGGQVSFSSSVFGNSKP